MDSCRMRTVDVPEFPFSSGARGSWQQQRCESLHFHEESWGFCTTKCHFLLTKIPGLLSAPSSDPIQLRAVRHPTTHLSGTPEQSSMSDVGVQQGHWQLDGRLLFSKCEFHISLKGRNNCDMNYHPWSVVIFCGQPKRETHAFEEMRELTIWLK